MTITKAAWYKKHVEPSFIQQYVFPFLFFPSSNRGVRENRHSPRALLIAKAIPAPNTQPPRCFPSVSRQGVGWGRARGWSAEGGSCQSGKKEGKHLFRGQTRGARSATETQPLAAAMQLRPKSAQHRQSHSPHARAGPEDLGQLEEGV